MRLPGVAQVCRNFYPMEDKKGGLFKNSLFFRPLHGTFLLQSLRGHSTYYITWKYGAFDKEKAKNKAKGR